LGGGWGLAEPLADAAYLLVQGSRGLVLVQLAVERGKLFFERNNLSVERNNLSVERHILTIHLSNPIILECSQLFQPKSALL